MLWNTKYRIYPCNHQWSVHDTDTPSMLHGTPYTPPRHNQGKLLIGRDQRQQERLVWRSQIVVRLEGLVNV